MTSQEIKQIIEQEEENIKLFEEKQQKFQELIDKAKINIASAKNIATTPKNPYERAKKGEQYYSFCDDLTEISSYREDGVRIDDYIFENGLYFNEKTFAEKTAKEVELYLKLKKFTYDNGWSDEVWNNTDIPKYSIRKTHLNNIVTVCELFFEKTANVIYFSSEKIAQQAIETFRELIEEVL